jgi:hypothetical protein
MRFIKILFKIIAFPIFLFCDVMAIIFILLVETLAREKLRKCTFKDILKFYWKEL